MNTYSSQFRVLFPATGVVLLLIVISLVLLLFSSSTSHVNAAFDYNPYYSSFSPNTKTYIFSINPNEMRSGDTTNGARIWISNWYYKQTYDRLGTDATNINQMKQNFDSSSGMLTIEGSAAISDYAQVLNWAWFYTTSYSKTWRMFHWNLGIDTIYYPYSWRWWKWINASSSSNLVTWQDAKDNCKTESYPLTGTTKNQGYLATQSRWWEWYFTYAFSRGKPQWLNGASIYNTADADRTWRWQGTGPNQANKPFFYQEGDSSSSSCLEWCRWDPRENNTQFTPSSTNPQQSLSCLMMNDNSRWTAVNGETSCGGKTKTSSSASAPRDNEDNAASSNLVQGYWCMMGGDGFTPSYLDGGISYTNPGCGFSRDMNSCRSDLRCRWFHNNNTCALHNCALYTNPFQCRNFPDVCEFDDSPRTENTCSVKMCSSSFRTKDSCNNATTCLWMVKYGIPQCGERSCSLQMNPCDCYQLPVGNNTGGCFWDTTFYKNVSRFSDVSPGGIMPMGRCLDAGLASAMTSYDLIIGFHRPQSTSQASYMLSAIFALKRAMYHFPFCNTNEDLKEMHQPGSWIMDRAACINTTGFRITAVVYGDSGNNGPLVALDLPLNSNFKTRTITSPVAADKDDFPFTGNSSEFVKMLDWLTDEIMPNTDSTNIYMAAPLRTVIGVFTRMTLSHDGKRKPLILLFGCVDNYADSGGLTSSLRSVMARYDIKLIAARLGSDRPTAYPLCNVIPNSCSWSMAWLSTDNNNVAPGTTGQNVEYWVRNMGVVMIGKSEYGPKLPWGRVVAASASNTFDAKKRNGTCNLYTSPKQCEKDPMCEWKSEELMDQNLPPQCIPSTCLSLYCDEASCNAYHQTGGACRWDGKTQLCQRLNVASRTMSPSLTKTEYEEPSSMTSTTSTTTGTETGAPTPVPTLQSSTTTTTSTTATSPAPPPPPPTPTPGHHHHTRTRTITYDDNHNHHAANNSDDNSNLAPLRFDLVSGANQYFLGLLIILGSTLKTVAGSSSFGSTLLLTRAPLLLTAFDACGSGNSSSSLAPLPIYINLLQIRILGDEKNSKETEINTDWAGVVVGDIVIIVGLAVFCAILFHFLAPNARRRSADADGTELMTSDVVDVTPSRFMRASNNYNTFSDNGRSDDDDDNDDEQSLNRDVDKRETIKNKIIQRISTLWLICSPLIFCGSVATLANLPAAIGVGLNIPLGLFFALFPAFFSFWVLYKTSKTMKLVEKKSSPSSSSSSCSSWLFGKHNSKNQKWISASENLINNNATTNLGQLQEGFVVQTDDDENEQKQKKSPNSSTNTSSDFPSRWGFIFQQSDSLVFLILELSTSLIISLIGGLLMNTAASPSSCKGMSVATIFLQLFPLLFLVIKRPLFNTSRLDFILNVVLSLTCVVISIGMSASSFALASSSSMSALMEICFVVCCVGVLLSGIGDVILRGVSSSSDIDDENEDNQKVNSSSSSKGRSASKQSTSRYSDHDDDNDKNDNEVGVPQQQKNREYTAPPSVSSTNDQNQGEERKSRRRASSRDSNKNSSSSSASPSKKRKSARRLGATAAASATEKLEQLEKPEHI